MTRATAGAAASTLVTAVGVRELGFAVEATGSIFARSFGLDELVHAKAHTPTQSWTHNAMRGRDRHNSLWPITHPA